MNTENIVLKKREAAQFLRISLPTLDRLIKSGQIPFTRLGRRVLFLKEDLLKVLRKEDKTKEEQKAAA